MKTRAIVASLSLVSAVALSSCSTDATDLPLPGTTVNGESIEIQAEFEDALNLAIGAKVKVNGIDVGKVRLVETEDFHAVATLRVLADSHIKKNSTARLRYNTPLGELFVDIRSPKQGEDFQDGERMVPPQSTTAPTVEDALASASLLINGGGIEQLQTITDEFQKAVGDRGPTIRELLDRTTTFLQQANGTTSSIDAALRALNGASQTLAARQDVINRAVREIAPAAKVLRENTAEVVALLQQLVKLGRSANGLVQASRTDLLQTIRQLGPILDSFYSLRSRFGNGLRLLAKTSGVLQQYIPGDWGPTTVSAELEKTALGTGTGQSGGGSKSGGTTGSTDGSLSLPGIEIPPLPIIGGLLPGLLGRTSVAAGQGAAR